MVMPTTTPDPLKPPASLRKSSDQPSKPPNPPPEAPALRVNINGCRYAFLKKNISDHGPNTRLGLLANLGTGELDVDTRKTLCDVYFEEDMEHFFDRPRSVFESLTGFYQTGILHKPEGICIDAFISELFYWKISPEYCNRLCPRCLDVDKYPQLLDIDYDKKKKKSESEEEFLPIAELEELDQAGKGWKGPCDRLRFRAWCLMEEPKSSYIAKCMCFFSVAMIFINAFILIMASLNRYRVGYCTSNKTVGTFVYTPDSVPFDPNCYTRPHPILAYCDLVCVIWFTLEYFVRLWASPETFIHLKRPLNIVDALAILPFYVETGVFFGLTYATTASPERMEATLQIPRILRIFRIFGLLRIIKLARYSTEIRLLPTIFVQSWKELLMLLAYLLFTTFIVSGLLYYLEAAEPKTVYDSIPMTAWWSIATFFSFSETPPESIVGKLVATISSIFGVVLLALPISIIVEKFGQVLDDFQKEKKEKKYKNKLEEEYGDREYRHKWLTLVTRYQEWRKQKKDKDKTQEDK